MLRYAALASLLLVSCAAKRPETSETPPPISKAAPAETPAAAPAGTATPPPTSPARPASTPQAFRQNLGGVSVSGVSFDSRTQRLVVADQPLGLVVFGGKRGGSLNRSSLGGGLYLGGNSPALLRRERGASGPEVLQAGPFLVEGSKAIGGLSQKSSTARSFIAWDGGSGWVIARTGACSLEELARALAGAELGGVKVRSALNLDGGRSSDLWVSPAVSGGPISERPLWNKPVRNFLVLQPRG